MQQPAARIDGSGSYPLYNANCDWCTCRGHPRTTNMYIHASLCKVIFFIRVLSGLVSTSSASNRVNCHLHTSCNIDTSRGRGVGIDTSRSLRGANTSKLSVLTGFRQPTSVETNQGYHSAYGKTYVMVQGVNTWKPWLS
ncbi:hypothetical protein HanIR_Chr14g0674551 [Helianthus annuus]|nr:hypothetical protein HanIR_Chr14g0674551 [Helianthus annuus]